MKKAILFSAVALIALGACNKQKEQSDTTDVQVAELNERLSVAQDSKDSLIFLMSDIYSGIEEINVQEGLLYNLRGDENSQQRQEIIENLSRIKASLSDKQAQLDALTKQFNDSNDKNGQLAKEVQRLKQVIAQKETKIAQLEEQLKNAHTQISNLKDTVSMTRQQVHDVTAEKEVAENLAAETAKKNEQLINDANRVYYAIGTKKELEKNNILKKKKIVMGDNAMTYFHEADKRTLTSIPCHNKKVEIMSSQPADSYRIDQAADKTKTIVITNPARFWGTTNCLIIKVG